MKSRLLVVGWLATGVIGLAACGVAHSTAPSATPPPPASEPARQAIIIYAPEGSQYVLNALKPYLADNALPYEIKIMVGTTTDRTMQGLENDTFDMVFMHRRPKPDERIAFWDLLQLNVAVFTHPDVGVDALTTEQVVRIFSGEVTHWAEVGGRDQAIVPFILPEFDAITEVLREVGMGDRPFSASAKSFPNEASVMLAATGVPGGIGCATGATRKYIELIDLAAARREFHTVAIDGMTIDDPDYPLSIVVGFGYLPEKEAFLTPVFDWIDTSLRSPSGQQLLELFDARTPGR